MVAARQPHERAAATSAAPPGNRCPPGRDLGRVRTLGQFGAPPLRRPGPRRVITMSSEERLWMLLDGN